MMNRSSNKKIPRKTGKPRDDDDIVCDRRDNLDDRDEEKQEIEEVRGSICHEEAPSVRIEGDDFISPDDIETGTPSIKEDRDTSLLVGDNHKALRTHQHSTQEGAETPLSIAAARERKRKRIFHRNELRRKAEARAQATQEQPLQPSRFPEDSPPEGTRVETLQHAGRDDDDEVPFDEEPITSAPSVTLPTNVAPGAYAVNREGIVPRAGTGNDDITLLSELETVQTTDDSAVFPPIRDNHGVGTSIPVEAQLGYAMDDEMSRLREENRRLRGTVPLEQAEVANVKREGIGKGASWRHLRCKRILVLGVMALVVAAIVGVVVAVSLGNGKGENPAEAAQPTSGNLTASTPTPSTLSPTIRPTQSLTRTPIAIIPANWSLLGQVLYGKATEDVFGASVSLSRDGTVMAVGAPQYSKPGYVSVHRHNFVTQTWAHIGQYLIGQAENDKFGFATSINGDGTILAVGAPQNGSGGEDAGHVRVFEYDSASDRWAQLGSDIEGPRPAAGDLFGISVSLSDAGDILAIGANSDDTENGENSGSVRLFQYNRDTLSWNQLGQTLIGQSGDNFFGSSISLSRSGNVVVVGALHDDPGGNSTVQVSVLEYSSLSSRWDPLGDTVDVQVARNHEALSVSLDDSGLIMAVGSASLSESVLVYAYDLSMLTWNQRGQTLESQQEWNHFGSSVSLSGNGDVMVVGSPSHEVNGIYGVGQVTIFEYDTTAMEWSQVGDPLNGEAEDDGFGCSVSLSADGSVVGVGALGSNVNGDGSGSAYVFTVRAPTISPTLLSTPSPTLSSPPRPTPSPITLLPTSPTRSVDLEWFGMNAYFSGKNVNATIDDGSMITFQDDFDRPLNINSGADGEEVSREDNWQEGGIQRRVKFYFAIKSPGDPFYSDADEFGWYMYDARMYNAEGSDWVYWGGDYRNVSMVQTRPGYPLFYCDYFELNYVLGDDSPTQTKPGGRFEAENVTLGGYLEIGYDFESLRAFNPCTENFPGEECRAVNGNIFCGDIALTLDDFI